MSIDYTQLGLVIGGAIVLPIVLVIAALLLIIGIVMARLMLSGQILYPLLLIVAMFAISPFVAVAYWTLCFIIATPLHLYYGSMPND